MDARTKQQNLNISASLQSVITVDNIKVDQFIYLLLNNQEIREVIDTITSKGVLILGRFSKARKPLLDAIRDALRKPEHNYLPIMFDFEPLPNQTILETVKTLANMARFVIADLTDARSVLQAHLKHHEIASSLAGGAYKNAKALWHYTSGSSAITKTRVER